MINIDKYIDAVLGKFAQTQEDFFNKSLRLIEIRKLVRSDFYDMDIEDEPRYQRAKDKLNKDEFELMEKWLSQHPTHFNRERKRVYDECLSEYEKEKEINPFSEAYLINDNINLIETSINDSPMLPIVKAFVTDWEQIDFKELANLTGKIDFCKYLYSENQNIGIGQSKRTNNRIIFRFSKSEFVELVKSLIETKAVIGKTDKEVIEYFSKVLEVEIDSDSFHDTAYKFKNRKFGSEAPFLMKLKTNLINAITK